MTTTSTRKTRRESLNLKIAPADRQLIARAAQAAGKGCARFIVDAACRAAAEALLDRVVMTVRAEACAEFLKRLDQPPQPNDRLRRTMRRKASWQER